jgi:hypothetical protein
MNHFCVQQVQPTTSLDATFPPLGLRACQNNGEDFGNWPEMSLQNIWHNYFCPYWKFLARLCFSGQPFTSFGVASSAHIDMRHKPLLFGHFFSAFDITGFDHIGN